MLVQRLRRWPDIKLTLVPSVCCGADVPGVHQVKVTGTGGLDLTDGWVHRHLHGHLVLIHLGALSPGGRTEARLLKQIHIVYYKIWYLNWNETYSKYIIHGNVTQRINEQFYSYKNKVIGLRRAGPDGSFGPAVPRNSEVLGQNPGRVGYLSSILCIYIAPNLKCTVLPRGCKLDFLSSS